MMALSRELRKLIIESGGKVTGINAPRNGIIPNEPADWSARDELIYQVSEIISEAVNGPAIDAATLAEKIVDYVESVV